MNVLDSLKEHAKELYHDGIRTVGKFVAPVALVGVLASIVACSQPAPSPTPTPRIECDNFTTRIQCKKGGENVLIFKFEPSYQMVIGSTAQLQVFMAPEVLYSGGNEAVIKYSLGRRWAEPAERNIFASVPVNKEVTLSFKPENSNCFNFYLENVASHFRPGSDGSKWVAKGYVVGRPTEVSLKLDRMETTTYNPITILAEIKPSPVVDGRVQIVKDGEYKTYDITSSPLKFAWIPPDGPGVYKINVKGKGGSECEYIDSETTPIEVIVR